MKMYNACRAFVGFNYASICVKGIGLHSVVYVLWKMIKSMKKMIAIRQLML